MKKTSAVSANEAELEKRENRMGTEPVLKLLVTMSLPAIISMLVQAAYNIVDSVFVSRIGEEALAAVSLAFPIQILIVALSVGMGVGINSGIARRLGQRNEEEAVNIAEHGLLLSVILSILCVILAAIAIKPFLTLFSDPGPTLDYAIGYSSIVTYLAFGAIICQSGFAIMQGTGNMIQPMIGQLIGAIFNIIFDPILIFGLLGFPALGVNGAAIATVTGQILAMIYVMCIVFFRKKNLLRLNLKDFKYSNRIMKTIISVGLPSAIMQGIGSVMLTGYNLLLAAYGTTALAVFGVYFKVQSFIFMPIFGLCQGTMPIFGYNYGAQNEKRFMQTMKYALIISTSIMIIGFLWFEFFPESIFRIFDASEDMLKMGTVCLRGIAWHFPLAGISILISNSFQAMGKAYVSMISSILRQIIILLPAAFILEKIGGLDLNWYSFVISEGFSLVYLVLSFIHAKHKVLDKFPEGGIKKASVAK